MKKFLLAFAALLLIAFVAFYVWNNNRQMQHLQELVEKQAKPTAQSANSSTTPIITETRPASELARVSMISSTISQGWKLINNQNKSSAQQAEKLFREGLLNIDPQNPEFYNGLARSLLLQNKFQEAAHAWKNGISLAGKLPGDQRSEFYSGLGWAYWNLHDFARAKTAWEDTLKINPNSRDALSAYAWIQLSLGQFEQARTNFQILNALDTKNKNWVYGMNMARGHNSDLAQIAQFFKLPPITAFDHPLPTDPADEPATAPATAPAH